MKYFDIDLQLQNVDFVAKHNIILYGAGRKGM